ncbi:dioxygenase [Seminavis robusta]|uniref:Dioxygenase n=1 Tax=Seminavis robusta TaxID=568900 RepID=A0A9N8DBS4_9STRA|nr:dioxygenase [Seminavis robusta]|eukprot:Sro76_g041450.1 dioxygenase (165) ;mRNA; r:156-650
MLSFDATLDINQAMVTCESIAALSADDFVLDEAMEKFQEYGFIIIRCAPGKDVTNAEIKQNVLDLKPLFGNPAYHIRADKDGVCPVGTFQAVDSAKMAEYKSKMGEAKSQTNDEFEPHTDSSFQQRSDEFLSLTCYNPSTDGGESYVVSGAAIYEHVKAVLTPH